MRIDPGYHDVTRRALARADPDEPSDPQVREVWLAEQQRGWQSAQSAQCRVGRGRRRMETRFR